MNILDQDQLSEYGITIGNIVASLDLNIELDLSYLSDQVYNSSYQPERYPSLIFRPEGLPTVLITRSGVLLFTGGDSVKSIYGSYDCIAKEFRKIDIETTKSKNDIKIQNIVAIFEVGFEINLEYLSIELGLESVEYEPEQFPGIIYRIENGQVALIFSSGKIVITGGSSTEEILSAVAEVRRTIDE